jgi:hypothetical protein
MARTMTAVRALCCECGNLRTVSAKHGRRLDANNSADDSRDSRGWRMTGTLKCSPCGAHTRHAYLREDHPECRDHAEMRSVRGFDVSRSELNRQIGHLLGELCYEDLTKQDLQQLVLFLRPIRQRASDGTESG